MSSMLHKLGLILCFGAALAAGPAGAAGVAQGKTDMDAGDYALARHVLQPLAAHGDERAQYLLGRMFERGLGLPTPDGRKAVRWYTKAAQQAYGPAERALGLLYLNGKTVPQDYALARKWLERGAHDGSGRAQLALGRMFEKGLGGAPNPIMAYVWYDFAAARGNTVARKHRSHLDRTLSRAQLAEAQRVVQRLAPSVIGADLAGA